MTTDRLSLARSLLRENRVGEAVRELRAAVQLDPNALEARLELCRILGATGLSQESEQLADEALAIAPENADALALKGVLLNGRKEYEAARALLEKALQINPSLTMAYSNLAASLRELGRLDESEQVIEQGLKLDPQSFRLRYERAQTYAYGMKIKESILEVIESIKLNPYFERGYLALARLYREGGELDSAIEVLRDCLRFLPQSVEAKHLLKDLLMLKGDFAAAAEVWSSFVAERGNADDWMQMGNIHLAAGQFEAAEDCFLKAHEQAQDSWAPLCALGDLYSVAGISDKAEQAYRQSIELKGDVYQPHNALGLLLLKNDKVEEAIKEFSAACKLAPEGEPTPVYNLALGLCQARQHERARELLQIALNGAPSGGIYDEMRRLLRAIGREIGE